MEVTLQIQANQIDETVGEIFKNLTDDQIWEAQNNNQNGGF